MEQRAERRSAFGTASSSSAPPRVTATPSTCSSAPGSTASTGWRSRSPGATPTPGTRPRTRACSPGASCPRLRDRTSSTPGCPRSSSTPPVAWSGGPGGSASASCRSKRMPKAGTPRAEPSVAAETGHVRGHRCHPARLRTPRRDDPRAAGAPLRRGDAPRGDRPRDRLAGRHGQVAALERPAGARAGAGGGAAMSTSMRLTDDAIRAALTPAADVRAPAGLADGIRASDRTPQRRRVDHRLGAVAPRRGSSCSSCMSASSCSALLGLLLARRDRSGRRPSC